MPKTYTCEKCAKVFKQKGHFTEHQKKKIDWASQTNLDKIIEKVEEKFEQKLNEVVRTVQPKPAKLTTESTNLQSFFEDLHNLLWNKVGLSPENALKHMTLFFAYRMMDIQADSLQLPQECRWTYIASLSSSQIKFDAIKKGITAFYKNQVTKPFFFMHDVKKVDVMDDIIKLISRISTEDLQKSDTLGEIFEYMLGRGMGTMADEGQYFTNRLICKLAFILAYRIKGTVHRSDGSLCTFADWFCGTGGFTIEYIKGVKSICNVDWKQDQKSIYSQDQNESSVTTTLLNALITTGELFSPSTIRMANSFSDPIIRGRNAPFPDLTIDYCFMNPPYGGDKTKGKAYKFAYCKGKGHDKQFLVNEDIQSIGIEEDDKVSAGVQLAMATLSESGVCCIVLPQGFFFGASKKCVELRKKLSEEYKIWYIVDIASGSFLNTGTKTSMMVFQKGVGSTDKISFIGLDETLLVEASLEELRTKNYSLNFKQYLPQSEMKIDGFEMVKLGDILEFQKKSGKLGSSDGKDKGKFPFYTCAQKKMYVDTCEFTKTCLIVNRGGVMNVRVDKNFSISHDDIHVLSFIDGKTYETTLLYVGYYLQANMKMLVAGMNGTTLKHLNKSFLEDFLIPVPSLEHQQHIVDSIDGWTQLANIEEQALKILEKQMMYGVIEIGRGKPRVKLGDVCDINHGKRITKKKNLGTFFPVYGGGDDTFKTDNKNREGLTCKVSRFGISEHNCVQTIYGDYWLMDSGFTVKGNIEKTNDAYIYYWLIFNKELVYQCGRATAQMNMDMNTFNNLQIPLPPLSEQQTLQSDFDEIRHKHEKIARYKAKAQESIERLIPGANVSSNTVSESHSSICQVQADGTGCTCRTQI